MQSRAAATSQLAMGRRKRVERGSHGEERCGRPARSRVGHGVVRIGGRSPSSCRMDMRRAGEWQRPDGHNNKVSDRKVTS